MSKLKQIVSILLFSIFSMFAQSALAEAKVVLITGASGDIGMGVVKYFLDNKDIVLCQYNKNKEELDKLKKNYPQQLHMLQADLSNPNNASFLWNEVLKFNQPIDILINSVGIEKEDTSLEQIQLTLNVNYLAPRLLCDCAVEYFKQSNKPGIIINLGSRAAYRGLPKGYYTYADTKAALTKYSQDIARDNAKHRISVYVVAPGPVEGKMYLGLKEEVKAQSLSSMPTGKVVTVQEVVDMIAFLSKGQVPSATGGVFDLMGSSWAH